MRRTLASSKIAIAAEMAAKVVNAKGCSRERRKTPPRLRPTANLGPKVLVLELSN
jgi:hypothetical protein